MPVTTTHGKDFQLPHNTTSTHKELLPLKLAYGVKQVKTLVTGLLSMLVSAKMPLVTLGCQSSLTPQPTHMVPWTSPSLSKVMSPENARTHLEHTTTMVLSPQQVAPSLFSQAEPLHTSSHHRRLSLDFPFYKISGAHIVVFFPRAYPQLRLMIVVVTFFFFLYTPSSYSKSRMFELTLDLQRSNKFVNKIPPPSDL